MAKGRFAAGRWYVPMRSMYSTVRRSPANKRRDPGWLQPRWLNRPAKVDCSLSSWQMIAAGMRVPSYAHNYIRSVR